MTPHMDYQRTLARFIQDQPALHDELFKFTDPEVKEAALNDITQLDKQTTARLYDLMCYIAKTRIVKKPHTTPSHYCGHKVIYDLHGANAKVNAIWKEGRGKMRVYQCPTCTGYHLTHQLKH